MEPISELLDRVQQSELDRCVPGDNSVYFRWMVEATNRIQELEAKVEALNKKLGVTNERYTQSQWATVEASGGYPS